jgi:type IV secretory pathway VirB4 component
VSQPTPAGADTQRRNATPAETSPVRGLLARQGLALPRHVTTTAHLCALYPFALEVGLGVRGVFAGTDRLTGGGGFFFDLFEAYQQGIVQGPNMVVSGAGAHGKSAIVKAYAHRSSILATGGRRRFVAVIDPKGEWIPLARRLGWAALRLRPGGGMRVNPLDAGPAARSLSGDDLLARRASVASALLGVALGAGELSPSQQRLVSAAVRRLTAGAGGRRPGPTLVDLRDVLAGPDAALADELDTTIEELLDRRRPLLDAAAMMIEHDLRGMCDGPTTVDLDWDRTPGLVLDLSALLSHRKAIRLVLTAAAGWLTGVMYGQPDRHKLNIIDEGWAALDDLAIVRFLQDQWRLGRQWGCGNILITHAIADLRSQADDGTAAGKIAEGLLNTTSVRVFLHQNPEHVASLLADMGLTGTEAELLDRLPPFTALWKVGAHTAFVDHVIGEHEWAFCDTDTAMRGTPEP